MAAARYIVLLPLCFNDGRPVPQSQFDRYLDELFILADGYTLAGTVTGAYRMRSGAKQVDRCMEVWLVMRRSRESALERWLVKVGRDLGQEAMYLERAGGSITFVRTQ